MIKLVLLAFSLSLDTFFVALSYGLKKAKISFVSKLIVCTLTLTYFSLALFFGGLISKHVPEFYSKALSIMLMAILCVWMFVSTFFARTSRNHKFGTTSLVTLISRNTVPQKRNQRDDNMLSITISPLEAVFLGTALSADSISVGLAYSLTGNVGLFILPLIASFQFALSSLGNYIGLRLNLASYVNEKKLQKTSALIMAAILIVRIIEIL